MGGSVLNKELYNSTLIDTSDKASEIKSFGNSEIQIVTGEFWTSKQRQANKIHEVSYRACFKPQLPNYFINKFTEIGDVVYDPFAGRGTTSIEAALLNRKLIQNDINPISTIFTKGRLPAPEITEIADRLETLNLTKKIEQDIDLTMFYQKDTLKELLNLRSYLQNRRLNNEIDGIDEWIAMVATNRLAGHSPGFFSVYTFPPNQAVSQKSQIRINEKRNQVPEYRDVKKLIVKKSKQMQSGLTDSHKESLRSAYSTGVFIEGAADNTNGIKDESVNLVITSPPFLDIVNYEDDNWLRCWFNGIDSVAIGKQITMSKTEKDWADSMAKVFMELKRVLVADGAIAFEVGEIRNGEIKMEDLVIPAAQSVGLSCNTVLINQQEFTKTSNLWGVKNNKAGTNSNRIVILTKS